MTLTPSSERARADASDFDGHEHEPPALTAADRLNLVGLRATGPRLTVLAVFDARGSRHATADDIYRALLAQRSDVALGTVYRVLSQLTEVGILSRCFFEGGVAVYELRSEHPHDHLICLACGSIEEFVDPVIEERRKLVAQARGYAVSHRQLALYGYCPACRLARDVPQS